MLGSGGGELSGGISLVAGERAAAVVGESGSLCCAVCFVHSPYLYRWFPLFAVLLNFPYPNPPVSASFFPFSPKPQQGEGRPRGAFVSGRSQTITVTSLLPKWISCIICFF